jgi:hypothetical protein
MTEQQRIQELLDYPNRDEIKETDIPLIRAGILFLNWTDRPADQGGRCSPFVTPSTQALTYLDKHKRLTPAHRRTLRGLAKKCVRRSDIEWAKTHIQPSY